MLFSKKLKELGVAVKDLDDSRVYNCEVYDKEGNKLDEMVEMSGKELKFLYEMNGMKKGMVKYSINKFYSVLNE